MSRPTPSPPTPGWYSSMDSTNDPPPFLPQPPTQCVALFSSSSTSSPSPSPPPPPAPSVTEPSFSSATLLEPLPPVSPSSSKILRSKEHPLLGDKLAFSSSALSSSRPSLAFGGSAASKVFDSWSAESKLASFRELSCPAEPKISSFGELSSGLAASPSAASPMGMGPPASQACSLALGDLLASSSSSSQLSPGHGATSPVAVTSAGKDTGVPRPLEALQTVPIPPFLSKTYELVDDASLDAVVSWVPSGESFVVWDPVEFSKTVLPRHFKHNNFSSFVRQLNTYVGTVGLTPDTALVVHADRWEFANEGFLRGHKHLLRNIHRRRSSQLQQIDSYLGSSIELGRSGLDSEVEKLRQDKNLLMQEVVKLQEEHLTMIHQMDTVKQRMQLAEQRQKKMVSFLAIVIQNPAFLEHQRQQQEQRGIASTRVKRKFLKQPMANQSEWGSPCEGQIVKFKKTLDGVISSSTNPVMETNVPNQLPDYVYKEIEKLELDMNSQEFLLTSDDTGEGIPAFMDTSDAPFKGMGVISSPVDTSTAAAAERFMSFPEDISQETIFLDAISLENEDITLPEETWSKNCVAGASLLNFGNDVWDKLFDEDSQELDVEAGCSSSWNIESGKGGDLEIDKLVGDSSFQGHQDQGGFANEDSLTSMDP